MKLKYYQDRKGGWRWTLYARNGLVVGASTESYATKARAIANFHTVSVKSANAKVEVVEKPKKTAAKKTAKKAKKTAKKATATKKAAATKKPAAKKATRKRATKKSVTETVAAAAAADDGF